MIYFYHKYNFFINTFSDIKYFIFVKNYLSFLKIHKNSREL